MTPLEYNRAENNAVQNETSQEKPKTAPGSMLNKTRTPQVGAISKAQKAQNIFFGKKLEIFEKKILSENVAQCRKM